MIQVRRLLGIMRTAEKTKYNIEEAVKEEELMLKLCGFLTKSSDIKFITWKRLGSLLRTKVNVGSLSKWRRGSLQVKIHWRRRWRWFLIATEPAGGWAWVEGVTTKINTEVKCHQRSFTCLTRECKIGPIPKSI